MKDSSTIYLNKITINKIKSSTSSMKWCGKKKVDFAVDLKLVIVK